MILKYSHSKKYSDPTRLICPDLEHCLRLMWHPSFLFAIRMTPSARVTVVTIGRPSGIAATAKLT